MADDKHYVGGQWYRICDRTGFKIRDTRTKKQWDNLIVREQSWEPRQPQDFVRGVTDDQTVSDPRPRQVNSFQGPLGSTLNVSSPAGEYFISIVETVRMFSGDNVQVMLDNNEYFFTKIDSVVSVNVLKLIAPLPYSASSGNVFIDSSAMSNPVLYDN